MKFLEKVELAFKCPIAWDKLIGDGSQRFCGECEKQVTDLSAMTRRQASAWLSVQEASICVRVAVDADGRSVHRPAMRPAIALSIAALAPVSMCDDGSNAVLMGEPPPIQVEETGEVSLPLETPHELELMGDPAPFEPILELGEPVMHYAGGLTPAHLEPIEPSLLED